MERAFHFALSVRISWNCCPQPIDMVPLEVAIDFRFGRGYVVRLTGILLQVVEFVLPLLRFLDRFVKMSVVIA